MNSKFILQSLKSVWQKAKQKNKFPFVSEIGHVHPPSKNDNTDKNPHKTVPASMTNYNKKNIVD